MRKATALLGLLLLFTSGSLWARPPWLAEAPRHDARQAPRHATSLDEAAQQVRKETGGRILSGKTVEEKGRRVHRIKVLTPKHRVRVIRVEE